MDLILDLTLTHDLSGVHHLLTITHHQHYLPPTAYCIGPVHRLTFSRESTGKVFFNHLLVHLYVNLW